MDDASMKTVLSLLLLLLTVTCGAAEPKRSPLSPFLGHWRYADETLSCDYIFHEDGTYKGTFRKDGKVWAFSGNWWFANGKISYVYSKSEHPQVPVGRMDIDEVMELKPDSYVIKTKDGSQRKYVRVK
jgi:hypothetical protein